MIPAAIKAAQDEVRARHLVAEGLAGALTESRVEAEREALRKKVMGAMAEGGSIEAAARAVGITVQEAKSVLPASAIGGTPAARRGENPRDFRDLRG